MSFDFSTEKGRANWQFAWFSRKTASTQSSIFDPHYRRTGATARKDLRLRSIHLQSGAGVSDHSLAAREKFIGHHMIAAKLTEWKKELEKAFLSEVSSVVFQQSLRNLDAAFTNFFDKRAGYPRFKSKHGPRSVRYATNAFTHRDGQITLAKQSEPLNIAWSRPLPDDSKPVNLTVSKDKSERYYVGI